MEGTEKKKGGLNLPAGMCESSLRIDAVCTTSSQRFISNLSSPSKSSSCGDRFIPCRSSSRLHTFSISSVNTTGGFHSFSRLLLSELFGPDMSSSSSPVAGHIASPILLSPNKNMLRFKPDPPSSPTSPFPTSFLAPDSNSRGFAHRIVNGFNSGFGDEFVDGFSPSSLPKPPRKVPKTPNKVLDAPSLKDDFYLNLVDWSSRNVLAVGLGTCVYLWTASNSNVTMLCDLAPDDSVCSVQWTKEGSCISIGTSLGHIQVWDISSEKIIRRFEGHEMRTGVLAWSSQLLSSGSRDRTVLHHDLRSPEDYIKKLVGHKSEICGLKWSDDDRELASGGNDNQLLVWNQHYHQPKQKLIGHTAAVKAIAWSPHQSGLLVSGGGTADRTIRFWNTANGSQLQSVETGSQVCNLAWSKNVNEVVSTHGFSQNQVVVWKYPSMSKVATLTGHGLRVLYLAVSPDGQTIVTGAGDETLRFWNVFPSIKSQTPIKESGIWSLGRTQIR